MEQIDKLVREKLQGKLKEIDASKIEVTDKNYEKMKEKILEDIDKTRLKIGKCYEDILLILKKYCDMPKDYYPIIALWIIGTYVHKEFDTFPYLYFNAMRGSGKTRIIKLISKLSANGELLASLTDAILFRTTGTLCIDEFEGVGKKEKSSLRELLNTAYKKGTKIKRMRKSISKEGENQVVEEFKPYRPIVMANIWGMDEVINDRCLSFILEKSQNPKITKLIEDFDTNEDILCVKETLSSLSCSLCSVVTIKNCIRGWNEYILSNYTNTLKTPSTITTHNNTNNNNIRKEINNEEIFNKIDKTNIDSRNLELFFPLFIIADSLDWVLFDNCLEIAKKLVKNKTSEEFTESKDVLLIDFVSQQQTHEFIQVREITKQFKEFIGEGDDKDDKWVNTKWLGRALKRLNLTIEKKRTNRGVFVLLDIVKAKDKILMFK